VNGRCTDASTSISLRIQGLLMLNDRRYRRAGPTIGKPVDSLEREPMSATG
jgi:hypothetical protein